MSLDEVPEQDIPAPSGKDADPTQRRYSFVTVVFESELLLLRLQARSFARFLALDMVDQVIVIDNSKHGCLSETLAAMMEQYGPLASRVSIVPAAALMPPMQVDGWLSQQVLKLQIARRVTSDRYVVLDSKTHLVAPLTRDFLETKNGHATIYSYSYEQHGLRPYLERSFAFMEVSLAPVITDLPTSVPPFTIIRQEAIDLVDHVEALSSRPFHQVFIDKGLTEFFLYSAWLLKRHGSIAPLYSATQPQSPTIWEKWTYPDKIRSKLDQATISPFFSIHRRALPKCPKKSLRIIEAFWVDRGLFANQQSARSFIREFITSYRVSFLKERIARLVRNLSRNNNY